MAENSSSSHTVIIGGGVIGATTLYELTARGLDCTLIEEKDELAAEASFANGGMLTPSLSEPWNGPGVLRHLMTSLFEKDAAMRLRWAQIPNLTAWGLRFLANSSAAKADQIMQDTFLLANHSLSKTNSLREKLGLEFDFASRGVVGLFKTQDGLDSAYEQAMKLLPHGLSVRMLPPVELVEMMPELAPIANHQHGALYYPDDCVGDANGFTRAVAAAATQSGATIQRSTEVTNILLENGRVIGVETKNGAIQASRVVVCAGHASPSICRKFGVNLPVKPAKGYSLTFELDDAASIPSRPVVDNEAHVAVTPLGDRVRVVGMAEFAGLDDAIEERRIDSLVGTFEAIYPELASHIIKDSFQPWTNFRPVSADGKPFIGSVGPEGLYVNAGHGHLGWTLAAGSAELLGDWILNDSRSPIQTSPFSPKR